MFAKNLGQRTTTLITISQPRAASTNVLIALAAANAVTVSTLYWGQALVWRAIDEFGPSATISLMPGATLIGYAAGVAGLAAIAGDLTDPRNLGRQFLLLVAALCGAALAPTPVMLTGACLLIGVGCALTQRLLCCATTAVAPEHRAQTIGWIIAAGLCGIVLARAFGPAAADFLGWRPVFAMDAVLAGLAGAAATTVSARLYRRSAGMQPMPLPKATSLWRGEVTLRRAALQQAVVFAVFNMGWAVFPRIAQGGGALPALSMGIVALLGASAALVSGRFCARWNTAGVARAGFAAVSVASVAVALGLRMPLWCYLGMGLLDAGTQVSLVANQARAQALASTPAMRGRLAAIVTTIGFVGGAAGSAIGNLLIRSM